MTLLVLTDSARPWATLFNSPHPVGIAAAVHAQTGRALAAYASRDGASFGLDEDQKAALSDALAESYKLEPVPERASMMTLARVDWRPLSNHHDFSVVGGGYGDLREIAG